MSSKAFLQSLYKMVAQAPLWFAAGTLVGALACTAVLTKSGGAPTTELLASVQIGQYWLKLTVLPQPLEHPNRMLATLKQSLLDTEEGQNHIVSYSYITETDPWGLRLTLQSKDHATSRTALESAIKKLIDRQNASYESLADAFSKRRSALELEKKAISEMMRDSLTTKSSTSTLSYVMAKSLISDNEVAQIESSLTTDPAHFRKSTYVISEQPKTLGRLRMLILITIGCLLSLGVGLFAAKIGISRSKFIRSL